ncbi:unnamed protein product [Lepeophtheirus salmonis]|uniref:(salmon louse) hypothetical protein n=1 Tax=Lepeophtheirus salmonis TaxID=72036 RepID=A0A7R8CL79_LEPSM|nr:unnamed protein product [Lepeophtheirus salmonis]CAF2850684.1 unnamed protein product [Lepeophtheirus salmonis]
MNKRDDNYQEYNKFCEAFRYVHPDQSKNAQFEGSQALWNAVKHDLEIVAYKFSEFQIQSAGIKAEKMNFELKSVQRSKEVMDIKPNCSIFKRAQENLKSEINRISQQISNLKLLRNSGLSMTKLKRLQSDAQWQRNRRIKVKNDNKNLCESNSEVAATLKSMNRGTQGGSRLEIDPPQLLSTILDIDSSSSSDDKK